MSRLDEGHGPCPENNPGSQVHRRAELWPQNSWGCWAPALHCLVDINLSNELLLHPVEAEIALPPPSSVNEVVAGEGRMSLLVSANQT